MEHVFKGTKDGGFHYEGLSDATSKVIEITKFPDTNGVYEAMVEVGGKVKKQPSTFFPKDWSPEQVLDAIEEANRVFKNGNRYEAVTSSGITVGLYLNMETNKVISAFPIIQ